MTCCDQSVPSRSIGSSSSILLSYLPLPHDVDEAAKRRLLHEDGSLGDGSPGHRLRNWAHELMTHMRSPKKSDRLFGSVLLTSGLNSGNRWQRLADLLQLDQEGEEREEGEEEEEEWQSVRQKDDRLSKRELEHLFSEIMSSLTPLLTDRDEDADVRMSAAEALRYTRTQITR